MNEQTSKLIEQLAQKLGTTTEYLWSVLLKQAPIDAATTLVQILFIALFAWLLIAKHNKLSSQTDWGAYDDKGYNNVGVAALMIVGAAFVFVMTVLCFCSFGDVINGFFNPEYWALKQILSKISQ